MASTTKPPNPAPAPGLKLSQPQPQPTPAVAGLNVQPQTTDAPSSITNTVKRKTEMAKANGASEQGLSNFAAFVLADFDAEIEGAELTVCKGDFVTVLVETEEAPPDGWCMCSINDGDGERTGLVPWYFLVSAAHAEMQAAYQDPGAQRKPGEDEDGDLKVDMTLPRGSAMPQVEMLDVMVLRNEHGALGIDIDEKNVVRRIADSARAENHKLKVGDMLVAVNGVALAGRRLLDVMEAGHPGYVFRVERRELGEEELADLTQGIMTTMRLQAVAAGFGEQDSSRRYVSLPGRQVTTGGRVHALRAQQRGGSKQNLVANSRATGGDERGSLPAGGLPPGVEAGARMVQVRHTITVRRSKDRLGIDINEHNVIVRILPDTPAEADGLLQVNDVVVAVDGSELGNRWLAEAIPPGKPQYEFTVVREEWQTPEGEESADAPNNGDIYALKSWALADMQDAVRAGEGDDAADEQRDAAEANAGVGAVFNVSGGTVPAWVFKQYQEMAAQPMSDLETPQLSRPRAPPGSRPKGSLKPKGAVWNAPDEAEEAAALAAPQSEPATAKPPKGAGAGASSQQAALAAQAAAVVASRAAPPPSIYAAAAAAPSEGSRSSVDLVERGPEQEGGPGAGRSAATAALASRISATPGQAVPAPAPKKPSAEGEIVTELAAKPSALMGGQLYRRPPKPPAYVSTMRMEDMLRSAMEAAATDEAHSQQFDDVLSKYRQHPGVLRREREAKEERRVRHELLNKPAYKAVRARIPTGVLLSMTTLDEFVDVGCSWELAEELVRFPMLKFVAAAIEDMEQLPVVKTLAFSLDRKMTEEQARACLYALPVKFKIDRKAQWGNKGMREEWLESQHRIFDEMEAEGFAEAAAPLVEGTAQAQMGLKLPEPKAAEAVAAGGAYLPRPAAEEQPQGVAPLREAQEQKAFSEGGGAPFTPRTQAAADAITPQMRASEIGSYKETKLIDRIGQGTYGSVFRGECNGEEVAVKIMALQADTAEDIKREIKIMQECSCANIVAYRDAFIRDHQMRSALWVVMEFCHVGSSLDMMRRQSKPLTEPQIAYICKGVLSALDYLHLERKTIHRDIKAANILVNNDALVKLADLGVAAQLYNTMSKRGTMIGTPHWMAPETLAQASGDAGKYGTKVDIWGLGITAIELAQMAPPFSETKSVFQVMMLIVNGPPAELPKKAQPSPDFEDFVRATLVKDAAKRPSAKDLLAHPFMTNARPDALQTLVQAHLEGNKASGEPAAAADTPGLSPRKESGDNIEKTMVL